jgi:hypothetical protein
MPRRTISPPHFQLTPALRERFNQLLITYPIQALQGKAPAPWPPHDQSAGWELRYEEEYGVGQFAYRKELLTGALRELHQRGRTDLVALCEILECARLAAFAATLQESEFKRAREFVEGRTKARKDLSHALTQAIRFYHLFPRGRGLEEFMDKLSRPYKACLKALEDDPLLNPHPSGQFMPDGHYRHAKAGRRPRPWVADGRRAMQQLKVPARLRDDLLQAVGLMSVQS